MKIIDKLDEYSDTLKKASVWHNSKEIIGSAKKDSSNDFIYEFYCYLRILLDLKKNYNLKYNEGADLTKNKFPKSPANKKNRPYFEILDKNNVVLYQLCAGTKIKVKKGELYDAPDISFQTGNSPKDNPTSKDVKLIMDAKNVDKVSKGQFSDFYMMIKNLDVVNAENEKIQFDELVDIEGNCLISFGETYTTDAAYLDDHNLCALENFNEINKFKIHK